MDDFRRVFTVWRFSSPLSGEVKIVPRIYEPDDIRVQHEYQRVLWQGLARSKGEALLLAGQTPAEVITLPSYPR